MSEQEQRIPDSLVREFHDAIEKFIYWCDVGGDEPLIKMERLPIRGELGGFYHAEFSSVCDPVMSFAEQMPERDYNLLCDLAQRPLRGDIPVDRSYSEGAKCFRKLIARENQRRKVIGVA